VTRAPNGFRETEIGPIPAEWEVVSLGRLCQLGRDTVAPQELPAMPYVGLEHIDSGEPKLRRWGSSREVRSSKNHFVAGDVLYGKLRPYLDKAVLAEFEGVCSTEILIFKTDSGLTVPEFLVHTLHTQRFLSYAISTTTGTNLPRTRWTSLKDFKLVLPPLPEQRRIAHLLGIIQRVIAAQDDLIAAAREVKRSLMQRLFTFGPGPTPVPTKETQIGDIPEHWEVVRLGDVAGRPQYGYTASASERPVGPKFLRITDIQEGRVSWSSVPCCEIDGRDLAKYELEAGDVVFARIGATTGKTYLVTECPSSVFASYLMRVRVKPERVLPEYVHYFTNTEAYWRQIDASKGGRLKKGINIPVLTSLLLPLPPLSEQHEITDTLFAVDHKIETEEQRRAALQALFKTMLHQLMTGRMRV
jgi:type I restriction enzyme S subunit